jgi:hypothetical protein
MALPPRPGSPVLPPSVNFVLAKPEHALLLRICSKDYRQLDQAFRHGGNARFDDPSGERGGYSTLYCAPDFLTCYSETLIRDSAWRYQTLRHEVPLVIHNSRMLQLLTVDVKNLKLIDLFGSAMQMGLNNASGLSDYAYTRWLAYEMYHHPSRPDGIWYASKFSPRRGPAAVLFNRAQPHVAFYAGLQPKPMKRLMPMFDAMTNVLPVALV